MAGEAGSWSDLHRQCPVSQIDHSRQYGDGAEELFSRIRRAEIGRRHHMAGAYLIRYAQEVVWREVHRRADNGRQFQAIMGPAKASGPSGDWCGCRQRAGHHVLAYLSGWLE